MNRKNVQGKRQKQRKEFDARRSKQHKSSADFGGSDLSVPEGDSKLKKSEVIGDG